MTKTEALKIKLEAWMDAAERTCLDKGMDPGRWPAMRKDLGTVNAVKACLTRKVEQTPLRRLKQRGLLGYSLEAAVLQFPDLFTAEERAIAQFRIDHPEF